MESALENMHAKYVETVYEGNERDEVKGSLYRTDYPDAVPTQVSSCSHFYDFHVGFMERLNLMN